MAHVIESDEMLDPGNIGSFGLEGIMLSPEDIPDLIKELFPFRFSSFHMAPPIDFSKNEIAGVFWRQE